MVDLQSKQPAIATQLAKIIGDLEKRPFIKTVTLSTTDGLAIIQTDNKAERAAAVASLMATAAKQAQLMLDLDTCDEIMLSLQNNNFLVYHPFTAGGTRLILTVLFNKQTTYKRLLTHTSNKIKQIMENNLENNLWA